jgi:hypothetical protein
VGHSRIPPVSHTFFGASSLGDQELSILRYKTFIELDISELARHLLAKAANRQYARASCYKSWN